MTCQVYLTAFSLLFSTFLCCRPRVEEEKLLPCDNRSRGQWPRKELQGAGERKSIVEVLRSFGETSSYIENGTMTSELTPVVRPSSTRLYYPAGGAAPWGKSFFLTP
jgi:hypothetical protein